MAVAFQDYGRPLEMVTRFKYRGIFQVASYDNWMAVVSNLCKAWRKWACFYSILVQEGEDPQTPRPPDPEQN